MSTPEILEAHALKLEWSKHQSQYRAYCAFHQKSTDPRAFNTYLAHCIKAAFES